jgi:hypothetical protein
MELITAILAALMAIVSPVGTVVDSLAENAIRDQLAGAEQIQVRVDNVPNFQILQGRLDHARLAGRGLYLRQLPALRISALDLETDVVDVDLGRLRRGELVLDQPAQAALRVRLQADDLNAFLQSPQVQEWLDTLRFNLPGLDQRELIRYGLANPSLYFLADNRLEIRVNLEDRVTDETIALVVNLGLLVVDGHRLQLVNPTITADGEEIPSQLLTALVEGASQQFTLRRLDALGLTARIIDLNVQDNELDLAIFARIEPTSPFLTRQQTDGQAVPSIP